ncbi:hypothetical protein D3C80_1374340 [compost metagenome]
MFQARPTRSRQPIARLAESPADSDYSHTNRPHATQGLVLLVGQARRRLQTYYRMSFLAGETRQPVASHCVLMREALPSVAAPDHLHVRQVRVALHVARWHPQTPGR